MNWLMTDLIQNLNDPYQILVTFYQVLFLMVCPLFLIYGFLVSYMIKSWKLPQIFLE